MNSVLRSFRDFVTSNVQSDELNASTYEIACDGPRDMKTKWKFVHTLSKCVNMCVYARASMGVCVTEDKWPEKNSWCAVDSPALPLSFLAHVLRSHTQTTAANLRRTRKRENQTDLSWIDRRFFHCFAVVGFHTQFVLCVFPSSSFSTQTTEWIKQKCWMKNHRIEPARKRKISALSDMRSLHRARRKKLRLIHARAFPSITNLLVVHSSFYARQQF